jgi:hypothetical protein
MLFLAGFGVSFVVVAYTSFVPPDSATSTMYLASPETDYIGRCEQARNILFLISVGVTLLAAIMAFLKPRVAAVLWGLILLLTFGRTLLPSYPVQLFPLARPVFWLGMAIEVFLCFLTFRSLRAGGAPNPTLQRTPGSACNSKPDAPGPPPLS